MPWSFWRASTTGRGGPLALRAGESRKNLADLLSVSISQVSEMENGRKGTTMEKLAVLCRHYNISADYLLGLTDEPRPLRDEKR